MNTCVICGEHYPSFFGYDAHMNRRHGLQSAEVVTIWQPEKKKEYKPMDPDEKRRIVAKWEARNAKHLIG